MAVNYMGYIEITTHRRIAELSIELQVRGLT